jgi:hypothetical protein
MLCEQSLRLDLAEPQLRGALDFRRGNAGTIHWAWMNCVVASTSFVWNNAGRRLALTSRVNGDSVRQTVEITATTPHFGGARLWFVCPVTGARTRVLFLPPGARQWASRTAFGLVYTSQRMGDSARRLQRLIANADCGLRRNAMRRELRRRART